MKETFSQSNNQEEYIHLELLGGDSVFGKEIKHDMFIRPFFEAIDIF